MIQSCLDILLNASKIVISPTSVYERHITIQNQIYVADFMGSKSVIQSLEQLGVST